MILDLCCHGFFEVLIAKTPTWCVHYLASQILSQRNKIGVYIMRQNKKLTWLQTCFLGDVRVIWCNFLGDSLFQNYVVNFVEIVINHYLLITSHVSQAIASCKHYTSDSLLNLVHDILCYLYFCITYMIWFECVNLDLNNLSK